jgi:hypothetical protein
MGMNGKARGEQIWSAFLPTSNIATGLMSAVIAVASAYTSKNQ